jgi:hypothetical protein
MTTEEAKTKWCPMARCVERIGESSSFPRNRVAIVGESDWVTLAADLVGSKCIGSGCALWRRYTEGVGTDDGECGLIVRWTPNSVI